MAAQNIQTPHNALGLQQNLQSATGQQTLQTSPTIIPPVQEEEPPKIEMQPEPELQSEDWCDDKSGLENEQPPVQEEVQSQEPG